MEKNAVCIDLENYTRLIEKLIKAEEKLDEHNSKIADLVQTNCRLVEFIIKQNVMHHALKHYTLTQLTNVYEYSFALDRDVLKELLSMGVSLEQIIHEIKVLKLTYNSNKEEEDGNK